MDYHLVLEFSQTGLAPGLVFRHYLNTCSVYYIVTSDGTSHTPVSRKKEVGGVMTFTCKGRLPGGLTSSEHGTLTPGVQIDFSVFTDFPIDTNQPTSIAESNGRTIMTYSI